MYEKSLAYNHLNINEILFVFTKKLADRERQRKRESVYPMQSLKFHPLSLSERYIYRAFDQFYSLPRAYWRAMFRRCYRDSSFWHLAIGRSTPWLVTLASETTPLARLHDRRVILAQNAIRRNFYYCWKPTGRKKKKKSCVKKSTTARVRDVKLRDWPILCYCVSISQLYSPSIHSENGYVLFELISVIRLVGMTVDRQTDDASINCIAALGNIFNAKCLFIRSTFSKVIHHHRAQICGIDYAATRRPQRFVCETRETRETITATTYVHGRPRVQRININIYVCVINRGDRQ